MSFSLFFTSSDDVLATRHPVDPYHTLLKVLTIHTYIQEGISYRYHLPVSDHNVSVQNNGGLPLPDIILLTQ